MSSNLNEKRVTNLIWRSLRKISDQEIEQVIELSRQEEYWDKQVFGNRLLDFLKIEKENEELFLKREKQAFLHFVDKKYQQYISRCTAKIAAIVKTDTVGYEEGYRDGYFTEPHTEEITLSMSAYQIGHAHGANKHHAERMYGIIRY